MERAHVHLAILPINSQCFAHVSRPVGALHAWPGPEDLNPIFLAGSLQHRAVHAAWTLCLGPR